MVRADVMDGIGGLAGVGEVVVVVLPASSLFWTRCFRRPVWELGVVVSFVQVLDQEFNDRCFVFGEIDLALGGFLGCLVDCDISCGSVQHGHRLVLRI